MKKDDIIKKIEELDIQIKKYKKRLEYSDLCEDLYEEAILQKAILIKELEEYDKNPLIEGIKKFIPKKEKTCICDYFKK